MAEIGLNIDAGRLLFGLSRIGYTTSSAICDIIDNSIRAGARNINLRIKKDKENLSDAKKNNVRDYVIVDDGCGMSEEGIKNALTLGAADEDYEAFSLSKFGLGLKSAAFSQCDLLKVISSDGTNEFIKYQVSLPEVIERKNYFATKVELEEDDKELIGEFLPDGKGTIIKLSEVRKVNHPSVKKTFHELKQKIGIIYYYFLKDGLSIKVCDENMPAIDPLFVEEANQNGNLDENSWNGQEVRWIEKEKELVFDPDEGIKCKIEITQLPYPPIYKLLNPGESKDAEIRERYMIGARNYGFYVYRNKRLIAWADSLDGIIPLDQDYYAFRGRIFIDDSADDYFNIDVKKSTLALSDDAFRIISDFAQEGKNKSRTAWKNAGRKVKELANKEPNEVANNIVAEFEQMETLPGDEDIQESVRQERDKALSEEMKEKARQMTIQHLQDNGKEDVDPANLSKEDILNAIKGSKNPSINKIFRVPSVLDNLLWEPYYDTDLGNCVRVNKFHRFGRYIFEENVNNKDLQIIFELMLLQFAEAEIHARKNAPPKYKYEDIELLITEYRRIVSEFLANMCRRLDGQLPPFKNDSDI